MVHSKSFSPPFNLQKMLHRQTTVQPLVPGGGAAPPVNAPPAQANVPAAQPQPGVSKTEFAL